MEPNIRASKRTELTAVNEWDTVFYKQTTKMLEKKAKMSGIPPLKEEQEWIHDPKKKADLFAKVFASKAKLQEATTTLLTQYS